MTCQRRKEISVCTIIPTQVETSYQFMNKFIYSVCARDIMLRSSGNVNAHCQRSFINLLSWEYHPFGPWQGIIITMLLAWVQSWVGATGLDPRSHYPGIVLFSTLFWSCMEKTKVAHSQMVLDHYLQLEPMMFENRAFRCDDHYLRYKQQSINQQSM